MKNQASDEYIQPNVVTQVGKCWIRSLELLQILKNNSIGMEGGGKLLPPACSNAVRAKEITDSLWFERVIVSKGLMNKLIKKSELMLTCFYRWCGW